MNFARRILVFGIMGSSLFLGACSSHQQTVVLRLDDLRTDFFALEDSLGEEQWTAAEGLDFSETRSENPTRVSGHSRAAKEGRI